METAAKIAKIGDKLVTYTALLLIAVMLLFGGYSLWDMWSTANGAFVSNDLLQYKPDPDNPDDLSLQELHKINNDVRAWLTIDDTHIDYPVVQGKNDMTYLNRDVFGEFSLAGSIFLSTLNSPDFSDNYNIVYGHHVDGGAMFADVVEFRNKDFFDAHTTGTLTLLSGECNKVEIFACMPVDAYDKVVYRNQSEYNDKKELIILFPHLLS